LIQPYIFTLLQMWCIHSVAWGLVTFRWSSFSGWVPVGCGCNKGVWTL